LSKKKTVIEKSKLLTPDIRYAKKVTASIVDNSEDVFPDL